MAAAEAFAKAAVGEVAAREVAADAQAAEAAAQQDAAIANKEVAELKAKGLGVLITDHNVRETLEIVDRAYILYEGTILMEGAPTDSVSNEEVRRVYLGDRFQL